MRELAEHNLAKAHYAMQTLSAQPGVKPLFQGAPFFNEYVLQTEEAPSAWAQRLRSDKIVGGIDLSRWYPELKHSTLWCVTEIMPKERIDTTAHLMAAAPVVA